MNLIHLFQIIVTGELFVTLLATIAYIGEYGLLFLEIYVFKNMD